MSIIPIKEEVKKAMPLNALNQEQSIIKDGILDKKIAAPFEGILSAGEDVMKVAEFFGIERKDIGKMIFKAVLSGKGLNLFNEYREKKSKYERFVKATNDLTTRIFLMILAFYLIKTLIVYVG